MKNAIQQSCKFRYSMRRLAGCAAAMPPVLVLAGGAAQAAPGMVLYPVSYMQRIVDRERPTEAQATQWATARKLEVFAAPGEYEPATFVIYPQGGRLDAVSIALSGLTGPPGAPQIAASAIDPYLVKCWYTDVRGMYGGVVKREYAPELLVRNDGIVRVDDTAKANLPAFDKLPTIPDRLQPFAIAADGVKEIWLTIHVPANASPGRYRGTVTVTAGATRATIPLQIEVLNIGLCPPLADIGAFVTESDAMDRGIDFLKMEVADMAAHGFNFPIISHPMPDYAKNDFSGLKSYLDIYKAAGLLKRRAILQDTGLTKTIWAASGVTDADLPAAMQSDIRDKAKKLKEFLTAYDPSIDWYIYGMDETAGEQLKRGSRAQKIIREEGLKVLVATNAGDDNLDYNLWFTYVWFAHRGMMPTIADYHAKGKRVGVYTQMSHFKDPVLYRYRAGFDLWNQPLDGYAPWAYMDDPRKQWETVAIGQQSAWGFVRPATNGLISSVQWEGFREGADDYRYVTTLATVVEKARELGLHDPLLLQAEKLLTRVDIQAYNQTTAIQYLVPGQPDYTPFSNEFPYEKLQQARRQIADLIVALQTKFAQLSSQTLKVDSKIVSAVYNRKSERFSIADFQRAAAASTDFSALSEKFRAASEARDWAKAGPLADQLAQSLAANKELWAAQGFEHQLPAGTAAARDEFGKLKP